jgi:glycosyltransferase involved in cell wall biosynthesis
VFYALKQLSGRVRIKVIGYETIGSVGHVQKLQKLSQALGISSIIEWPGTIPLREDMQRFSSDCQIGLSLMPTGSLDVNLQQMTGASNKPFDYMACGLALLVSDLPDWKKMYVEPGYALACNPEDPESIASALRWFLDHPIETRTMGDAGRQRILSEWNYETQFQPVLDYMESYNK